MKDALLYEGKAKRVYTVKNDDNELILEYKNDATAFNGEKKEAFEGKGSLNNAITSMIFAGLQEAGISSHFIRKLDDTEQLVVHTDIIPIEVVVRNKAAGSISRRLGIAEKTPFRTPVIEFFYKDDALNDPLINDAHALFLTDVTETELRELREKALDINDALKELFTRADLELVDFKLEFGRLKDGTIVLSDEISPDTCRLWDAYTGDKLDKDVFRQGTGDLLTVYREVLKRLENKDQK